MPDATRDQKPIIVGLISDTHGQLRPAVLDVFAGVDLILHAGDVGRLAVLDSLRDLAPVRAVRGNVDANEPRLAASIDCELAGTRVHVSHGHELGSPTPAALTARYSADVIVYGHTHRALITTERGTLVVNPGAAGPARFKTVPSVALLTLPSREVRIIPL